MDKKRMVGRRGSRYGAVQAVYRWLMNQIDTGALWREVQGWDHIGGANMDMLRALIQGTIDSCAELEAKLAPHIDRPLEQLDPMERAILLVGVYELSASPELSKRIVINEAVELAKLFGAEDGHKYVNGVLDKLARQLRPHEQP